MRLDKPNLTGLRAIRFLTSDDYPPLNFALSDGTLTGFNVEIARAVCEELQIACTIQARRWDTLIDALRAGKGDAVVASIAATAENRARIDFTQPYYQTPARFVVRKGAAPFAATASGLKGRTVGVVGGSSHEAYVKAFFPGVTPKPYPNVAALETALRSGEIDAAFADGLTFSVWLNGELSANCCSFFGGPYCESLYFGEGVGIRGADRRQRTSAGVELGSRPSCVEGSLFGTLSQIFSDRILLMGVRLAAHAQRRLRA